MRGRTPQPLVQGTRESHIKERNEQNEPIANTISAEEIAVALILAVILMIGLLPISAFASNVGTQANDSSKTAESQEFMRIFHLDCGRKYFTVSEIEGIIDQLAENHFTHLQLAFGNDGLRFLLDDMSVTVNGTTYDKEKVKSAVQSGNSTYSSSNGTAGTMLSEGDMNAIIKHANEKGIQVIPMFNSPYHMDALLNAMENLGITDARKKLNNVNRYLNLESANAVAFVKALQQKYMDYFKSKGCKYYNIATDEYAFDHITDAVYTEFAKYVNDLAKMVKDTGMTPLAYNDGFYWKTRTSSVDFDTDIVICYWSNGGNRASAETLAGKHFKILNNTDDWYYVLGDYLYKAWGRDGQWGYADAMNGLSTTKVTQVKGDTNGKVVPIGSVLCCWCDGPSMGYDENGYSSPSHQGAGQTNKESVYNLIKAMAENNPDYFTGKVKLSASDDATGVSVAVTGAKGQKATVEVKKITSGFTFDTEAHVSYNVTPAVDGKAYTGEGTVTLPVPEGWATEASRIRAYIIDNGAVKLISGTLSDGKYTFQVPHFSEMGLVQLAEGAPSKTENITLTVGGTKTVSVDGIQEIVTAPNGQYATATTTTIPAGAVSYKATASANIDAYESYSWSNLIDGNASTFYWSHGAQTAGAYAQVDLETAIPFDTVRVTSPSDVGNDYCENATVQVSVDRSEWTDIGSYTGNKAAAQSFANTLGSARYIRVLIKNARNNWWKLAEIEWGNTQNGQFTRMAASGTVTVPERTSISFTGVAVGNTTAVIGDTQYNITVNDRVEIPITIIDYRADGLLFDYSYAHWGDYPDSYRYSLVHGKAIEETHYSTFVTASKDSNGLYYIDGTNSNVEKIAGTRIEQTRTPENSNYVGKFNPNNMDNSWSRAGLVQEKLGANGMPVYTDAAVRYVASLLEAGYYNNVSDSAYNCNSYIYETFVAANGKRTIHNTSTTAFSPQFEVTKSYANISNAYDLAWYLLNTIYQPDTEATVPVTDVNGQQREVPLYGMAVDAYKSIVLTDSGNGKYTFEAGYESNKVEYPRNVNFDRENGKIYNGGDEKNLGFYPLEGLGYEQKDLLKNTSFTDGKHRNGSFTLRGESQFVYNSKANLYFTFTGDDDVYMYINGVLALDLGGAHGRNWKKIELNSLDKAKYKLVDGQVATFTFFYMERCSDASTFGIETNMELVQRDIAVEKNAYSDSQYTNKVNSGEAVSNGSTVYYDLVVSNQGNTAMTNISISDTDSFGGRALLGAGQTATVTAGSKTEVALVSLDGQGYTYYIVDKDGNKGEDVKCSSLDELSKAVATLSLEGGAQLHIRFLTAKVDVAQSKIISYTNTLKVTAVSGGKTLSDSAIHTIYSYNAGGTDKTFVVDFGLPLQISGIFDSGANEYIDANTGAIKLKEQPTYGNVTDFESKGMDTSMVYKLKTNTTINGRDTIKLSVPYNFGSTSANLDKNIYIIPASNVYYEDSLASFADGAGSAADAVWSPDGKATSEQQSATQALEELGKSGVYGYDGAYNKDNSSMLSMGTARKVTVTSAMADPEKWTNDSAWPTASFTFTGTGFDVISLTNNKSGAIFVDVYKGSKAEGDRVRSYVVNNYYGYTYDETSKTWITTSGDNALYQIPVMKITDLDHGTYTAVVTVFYDGLFNQTGKSEYSFWLDAIRVYNPMGEDYDYTADNEGYPQYIKLRDEVVKKTATPNGNALFIDGKENAMIAEYANYGPNNEVYLMNGQAITFKIPQNANVDSIQIGAKAPDGKLAQMVVNKDKPVEISTATEMYYKINVNVSAADQTVVIANTDGSGILSLTNLKITFKNKPTDKITLTALNNQEQENAVSLVRALFTAPVATFSPETFEADWSRAVRAGKRATLTVKTSADVESITVDGQSITSYTTRTQRTGWGWWSPKVTYRVFTYTTTAPAQTTDYAVCAVNAEGTASEPITATLTVRPATWWNWWF